MNLFNFSKNSIWEEILMVYIYLIFYILIILNIYLFIYSAPKPHRAIQIEQYKKWISNYGLLEII
jgi:hypothetical protein